MLCWTELVAYISCIKKKPHKTKTKPAIPPKTNQKTPQQTNIISQSFCVPLPLNLLPPPKVIFLSTTTGIRTCLPPSPLQNVGLWINLVFFCVCVCMCRILKNTISSSQSCHASNNKLAPIYLFISRKSQYFWHVDWSHMLSEPVQVIPKCISRIILLHRDHHPLSEVWNTSFTIKTK